ncbi:Chromatin structure-remodeling complex protein rsc9 [Knufia fluminis]|uniref:Chromatin structure-remodeling complex protein rsc9 n=1 Tax=Knufia fluminis TaxID=191047 RepID=A0AAN8EYY5_9EURO|nr:Chromatin structure-remodeling complex protein rsc9 [Knufia fluminis]
MNTNGAPSRAIIEDEEGFLDDVERYMKQRGVPFDRDGKVAGRPVPLHRLYRDVVERGGYDAVTATRMLWREIAATFNLPKQHDGAMSYQLKQLYYKNLAAYEIEKYWGETPPAPSILEHLTAKGGDVRKRTHETMMANDTSHSQETERMAVDSPQQTPKQEKIEPDDQGSASRYPSRLRQQPKPVQLYQPDPTPSRTTRMRTTNSPQPAPLLTQSFTNASSNPRDPHFKIENYEPRPSMPLTLRPLVTPSSNPDVFYQRKAMAKLATIQRLPQPQDLLKFALPKASFDGPNIYVRCVQGLKSGIRREQEFALHHLVKVSHERGDKFKFEGFPTLAESLMEKVTEIAELAFGVPFQVSYMDARGKKAENTINAVHGTEKFAQRLAELPPLLAENEIEPEFYSLRLEKVNEATLVLRNMVTLEDNAIFLSRMAFFRDLLILALNLPQQSRFDEIKQYALDMTEMTSRFFEMEPADELYASLVRELASNDRGKTLAALRAIFRFDADADRVHPLSDIPPKTIEKLFQYCVLDDDELVEAVINFLYAWTASPQNLEWALKESPDILANLTPRLANLLLHGATAQEENVIMHRAPAAPASTPASIPHVPNDLFTQMLGFNEPERSAKWLRCCFEEAPQADVTQISIWQAYQNRFLHNQHIPAAEFIKQVSATVNGAQAQVVQGPGGQSRFIIKGIRPRRILVGLHGQSYYKCHWEMLTQQPINGQPAKYGPCSTWHASPEMLWRHLLEAHAQIPKTPEGKFQSKDVAIPEGGFKCRWVNCRKNNIIDTPSALARHFRMHVPENAEQNKELIYKLAGEQTKPKEDTVVKHTFYLTSTDERGIPNGIPFMSALLLFNLARYVGRYGGSEKQRKDLMGKLFSIQVRENLWNIFSKQRTIAGLIIDVIRFIEKGEASEKQAAKQDEEQASLF